MSTPHSFDSLDFLKKENKRNAFVVLVAGLSHAHSLKKSAQVGSQKCHGSGRRTRLESSRVRTMAFLHNANAVSVASLAEAGKAEVNSHRLHHFSFLSIILRFIVRFFPGGPPALRTGPSWTHPFNLQKPHYKSEDTAKKRMVGEGGELQATRTLRRSVLTWVHKNAMEVSAELDSSRVMGEVNSQIVVKASAKMNKKK